METLFQTPFTEAQISLLNLLKIDLNQSDMDELRHFLLEFKFRKLQKNIEQVADKKGYTSDDIEAMRHKHLRTPYKSYRKQVQNKGK